MKKLLHGTSVTHWWHYVDVPEDLPDEKVKGLADPGMYGYYDDAMQFGEDTVTIEPVEECPNSVREELEKMPEHGVKRVPGHASAIQKDGGYYCGHCGTFYKKFRPTVCMLCNWLIDD